MLFEPYSFELPMAMYYTILKKIIYKKTSKSYGRLFPERKHTPKHWVGGQAGQTQSRNSSTFTHTGESRKKSVRGWLSRAGTTLSPKSSSKAAPRSISGGARQLRRGKWPHRPAMTRDMVITTGYHTWHTNIKPQSLIGIRMIFGHLPSAYKYIHGDNFSSYKLICMTSPQVQIRS